MHKFRVVSVALYLSAALLGNALAQGASLYERLGKKEVIKILVDEFVGRVAADSRINKKFAKTNVDRVKFMLVEQLCGATGGPCKYTGLNMKIAHKNMGVTEGEFGALVEDFIAALDKFKMPEKEKKELLGLIAPMKSDIVEVKSKDTGTPLPAKFKPAPPLNSGKATAEKAKSGKGN